jgi:CRISPR-associated protein (TIGR03985 family)
MLEQAFDYLPTVDLLDYLVPGVLGQKGNLLKAVRLWVILRSLYGDLAPDSLGDDRAWFSNAQWRDAFLRSANRTKTLGQWLFADQLAVNEQQWRQGFTQRYGILDLDTTLSPFEVDDRTLRNDFVTLEKLGWLKASGNTSQRRYCKVSNIPDLPWIAAPTEHTTTHFIPNDLAIVVDHFPKPINGIQRFILDVEYIVSQSVSQQVDCVLQSLKQIWQQIPVPPVRLIYRSIRYYETEFEIITYPVCIYYFQRAPYLFAFGQAPQQFTEAQPSAPGWYDYRLDRILMLQPLAWDDGSLPPAWFSNPRSSNPRSSVARLPGQIPRLFAEKTPDLVQQQVAAALGVEIHRPIAPLLLRFERYFYGNYIANTERAKLFSEMSFEQAEKRFQSTPEVSPQGLSLAHWFRDRPRHQGSVFCLAQHRLGDNNVVMRLRAWGPNVEVLLPLSLRQRMTDDMQETWKLYGEHHDERAELHRNSTVN